MKRTKVSQSRPWSETYGKELVRSSTVESDDVPVVRETVNRKGTEMVESKETWEHKKRINVKFSSLVRDKMKTSLRLWYNVSQRGPKIDYSGRFPWRQDWNLSWWTKVKTNSWNIETYLNRWLPLFSLWNFVTRIKMFSVIKY